MFSTTCSTIPPNGFRCIPPPREKTFPNAAGLDLIRWRAAGGGVLCIDVPSSQEAKFTVSLVPHEYDIAYPMSIAEGETFNVRTDGLEIISIDDRHGVLSSTKLTGISSLAACVRSGLLSPYLKLGRLGQLNFSRRTFFIECRTVQAKSQNEDAARIWLPIDLTVLPRYEVAPADQTATTENAIRAALLVRNNTASKLSVMG